MRVRASVRVKVKGLRLTCHKASSKISDIVAAQRSDRAATGSESLSRNLHETSGRADDL